MNTPVRRIAIAVMAMILLLMANLTYVQVVQAGSLREDQRNQRVLLAEYSRQRGQISAQGQVLARSVETDGQYPYQREYPNGPVFASITGYYSLIYSAGGLERAANDVLNGSDDRLFTRRLSDLITGRDPAGGNVAVTIDPEVQQAAYDALSGTGTGAVVALQPSTGAILAMASTPSYDPNPLASFSAQTQQEAWAQYSDAQPPVLTNRAIQEIYPPGSTFKLIDVAAALESGRYTPESRLTAASSITLDDTATDLQNFNGNACGTGATASLREALQRSCNTAFAELALELGEEAIRDQAEAFGIGTEDIAIPMGVAPSTIGDIESTAALQQSSIGQRDVALTPMQNAMVVAAIANGGRLMAPYLIQDIQSQDLETVDTTQPDQLGQAVSPGVARTLTELMVNNENSYSGAGKIRGVQIAAKTGTAEWGPNPKTTAPHVWYVAFAPADNPQVAVAVLVEAGGDRNNLAATGGEVAAPIGRAVIGAALRGSQ
ncbi:penicillin-binding protein 2 [Pseudonocardia sp.]|uniref:peptidoglycan D,D-transpeptidase FtsI family protein n=1 Tax=Pseudonocardia sp. TaxID=60912 RepID=UPI00262D7561|nr:penicillin-binding protein 2 [Pseudonocardia sp.]